MWYHVKLRYLFLCWYTVGLVLMVFFEVPPWLEFSNGLFLVFYTLSLVETSLSVFESRRFFLSKAVIIASITFAIEYLGINTGIPFGEYYYYPTLGPLVLGVPFTIALAWVGVILNSLLLSNQRSKTIRALETGFWVILLDLILDPVAYVRNFWHWEAEGGFFGVPFVNFLSWGIIAACFSFLFPLQKIPASNRIWAIRIYQLMILLFGLLAWKEELPIIAALALFIILLCEGRHQLDYRQEKQTL